MAQPAPQEIVDLATRIGTPPSAWPDPPSVSSPRQAAVLVLFGPRRDPVPAQRSSDISSWDLVLLTRARHLRDHAGEIAFPGGRRETFDQSPADTAIREAAEEISVDPTSVQLLGMLPAIPLQVTRHEVIPVLAWWTKPHPVSVAHSTESEAVFRVPLQILIDPEYHRQARGQSAGIGWATPAFVLPGVPERLIWGFTAEVLRQVLGQAGWPVPTDDARLVNPFTFG